jgi:hypothetical protein
MATVVLRLLNDLAVQRSGGFLVGEQTQLLPLAA